MRAEVIFVEGWVRGLSTKSRGGIGSEVKIRWLRRMEGQRRHSRRVSGSGRGAGSDRLRDLASGKRSRCLEGGSETGGQFITKRKQLFVR